MNETLRLGTIAGVRIGVNWSVLVIFGLLLFGLAFGQFPALYPDHPTATYVVAGAIAAVVFFLSLLAHEVSHAVVARREGVEVEGITLWLFGGVAKLKGEAPTPAADLRIAGVGPLVSLLLGIGFGGLAFLAGQWGVEELAVAALTWLAFINVVLAVFNLFPAAPLDGGRILRGILWWRTGDRVKAAVTAARAGRGFGFLLIMGGIALVLLLPGIGGLWLALIGWFISSAAGAEEQHARVQGTLGDVRVSDVMTREPLTVPGALTVAQLLDDYVLQHRHSAYPVVDSWGRAQGLVTLASIRGVSPEERASATLEQVAYPMQQLPVAGPSERLVDVLPRLSPEHRRILVLQDGQLVGLVTTTDITRALELAEFRRPADGPEAGEGQPSPY